MSIEIAGHRTLQREHVWFTSDILDFWDRGCVDPLAGRRKWRG